MDLREPGEHGHAVQHRDPLGADPFLFPGLVAGGPNASPEPGDTSNPVARPIPIWGYWGDPAFPRDAQTPYEQRYTDNDSYSTNEVSLDWQAPVPGLGACHCIDLPFLFGNIDVWQAAAMVKGQDQAKTAEPQVRQPGAESHKS